jgi:polyisoprenyl-teichoic acid--peptidoglycan teichoic acid transferase
MRTYYMQPMDDRIWRKSQEQQKSARKNRANPCGCFPLFLIAGLLGLICGIYFFAPGRTNILLLGIDQTPPGSNAGRSDTMILTTIIPADPFIGILSIPRDLWVTIPGYGENRINTAHFFAEAAQAGSGPAAAMQVVGENFGVDVDQFIRIKFEGFRKVFDAMGGLDIELTEPMAGYAPGKYHLSGNKALALARNRTGTDDFYRMNQGQFILKAAMKQLSNPTNWYRLPGVAIALSQAIDTDVPIWLWPRLGFAILRVGAGGIDSNTITREMVTSTTTDQGAAVLLPNWAQINPLLLQLFGQ